MKNYLSKKKNLLLISISVIAVTLVMLISSKAFAEGNMITWNEADVVNGVVEVSYNATDATIRGSVDASVTTLIWSENDTDDFATISAANAGNTVTVSENAFSSIIPVTSINISEEKTIYFYALSTDSILEKKSVTIKKIQPTFSITEDNNFFVYKDTPKLSFHGTVEDGAKVWFSDEDKTIGTTINDLEGEITSDVVADKSFSFELGDLSGFTNTGDYSYYCYVLNSSDSIIARKAITICVEKPSIKFTNDSGEAIYRCVEYNGYANLSFNIFGRNDNTKMGYTWKDPEGKTDEEIIDSVTNCYINNSNPTTIMVQQDSLTVDGSKIYAILYKNSETEGIKVYDYSTVTIKRSSFDIDSSEVQFILKDSNGNLGNNFEVDTDSTSISLNYRIVKLTKWSSNPYSMYLRIREKGSTNILFFSNLWENQSNGYYAKDYYFNDIVINLPSDLPLDGKDFEANLLYKNEDTNNPYYTDIGKTIFFSVKNQDPLMTWENNNFINTNGLTPAILCPQLASTQKMKFEGVKNDDKIIWTTDSFDDEDSLKAWALNNSNAVSISSNWNGKFYDFDLNNLPNPGLEKTISFYVVRNINSDTDIRVFPVGSYLVKYANLEHHWNGLLNDINKRDDVFEFNNVTPSQNVYFCETNLVDDVKVGLPRIEGYYYNPVVGDEVICTTTLLEGDDLQTWADGLTAEEVYATNNTTNPHNQSIPLNTYVIDKERFEFTEENPYTTLYIYVRRDIGTGSYKLYHLGDVIVKEAHDPELTSIKSSQDNNRYEWRNHYTTKVSISDISIPIEAVDLDTGIDYIEVNYMGVNGVVPKTERGNDGYTPNETLSKTIKLIGLTEDEIKSIVVNVYDKDGRKTEYKDLFINKPDISVQPQKTLETLGKDLFYTSNRRNEKFNINIHKSSDDDLNAISNVDGLKQVTVTVNGVPVVDKVYDNQDDDVIELNMANEKIQKAQDDKYHVVIKAWNNLENENVFNFDFVEDSTIPTINKVTVKEKEISSTSENNRYTYITNSDEEMAIFASDGDTSGLKNIKYYWLGSDGSKSSETVVKIDNHPQDANTKFKMGKSNKGFLCVKAEDILGNTPDKYATYGGIIVELPATHNGENHIDISVPESGAKDKSGNPLYNSAKNFTISVSDRFSGIRSVEWSINAPHDSGINKSGSLNINDGNLSDSSWSKNGTDKNLVTAVSKQITVDGNSDDIVLWVKMTDNAGNTSEKKVSFSIDKVKPAISVTYNNQTGDPEFTNYFADTRTATIVIKERNFNQESANNIVSNTLGNKGSISTWKESRDDKNPDNSTYTATVTFDKDDRYNLTYQVSDRAGNGADAVTTPEFVIDKINPEISIAFDNGNGINGYFANVRTATISVKDVNFDAGRVTISGINAQDYTLSNWTRRDNTYSALITFSKDGVFAFEASVRDKAGNQGNTARADKFTIDQTKPEITIEGVQDKSAYSGSILPVISFKDTNIDKNSVKLELIGANNGLIDLTDRYTVSEDGLTYTLKNIEKVKENDDIYTLRVTVKDLAGNTTVEEIKFAVNRFGSIYVLGDLLKGINDKYVRNAKGLKITEINVNKIKKGSVVITLSINGVPKTLVEGTDFTISSKESDAEWNEYVYELSDSLFGKDGSYIISISSEDEAGNKNNSDNEEKEASIKFGVDATSPIIAAINFEPNTFYAVNGMDFVISVKDNMLLDSFEVYVNGQKAECRQDGEMVTFYVAESNRRQDVKVIAKDKAGNETIENFEGILVAGNILIRFAHNKAAIIITAVSLLLVFGGIGTIIGIRRSRL